MNIKSYSLGRILNPILTLTLFIFALQLGYSQTIIQGTVVEQENKAPVPFATIALIKNDKVLAGTDTDFDGKYIFKEVSPGTYDMEVSFLGFDTQKTVGVIVKKDQTTKLDLLLSEASANLKEIVILQYKEPLVSTCGTTQGKVLTAEDIRNLPVKNVAALKTANSETESADNGDISIGSGRGTPQFYYIDGKRVESNKVNNNIIIAKKKKKFRPFSIFKKKKKKSQ